MLHVRGTRVCGCAALKFDCVLCQDESWGIITSKRIAALWIVSKRIVSLGQNNLACLQDEAGKHESDTKDTAKAHQIRKDIAGCQQSGYEGRENLDCINTETCHTD